MMKFRFTLSVAFFINLFLHSVSAQDEAFELVFFTDVHLEESKVAQEGFKLAIERINTIAPDFCISGGDYTGFSKGASMRTVEKVSHTYNKMIADLNCEVKAAMGNHELLHHYNDSANIRDYLGQKEYYSFAHKGWHFMVLNGVSETNASYVGEIDSLQMEWIKADLSNVNPETPIALVSHIPFQTVLRQRYFNATKEVSKALLINNTKEVLDLFNAHNLKLVLQGHTHIYEDISVGGVRFVTGGAVCGAWWKGPRFHTKQGFLLLLFNKDSVKVEYQTLNE